MFSDRQLDGIERGPEQFFKRHNTKAPEKGGARKVSYGNKFEAAQVYQAIRARWAQVQNEALAAAGIEVRVDHRSLRDQGIVDREPGVHRGRVVNAIEARGEISDVGERKREQRLVRVESRGRLVAELVALDREEAALQSAASHEIE
jgi:response regulator RpfG family c-di-GMP phosphodiesterase